MFQIKFTERNRTCCRFLFFANWLQRPFWSCARSIFQRKSLGDEIEWRSVTSRYHGSQISGSQQFFLTETGKSYISYHTCSFFPVKFAGPGFVEIQKFYYHGNDVSSLSSKELYHGHLASWVRRDPASKRGNRLGESRKQKQKAKQAKLLQWTTLWRLRLQVFSLCTDVPSFLRNKSGEETRFVPEGGGDVCTQASRCSSWQRGMKGTTQASGDVSTSAGTCWHNFTSKTVAHDKAVQLAS